ncbi:hypothetical protein DFH06DRAFT_1345171 [Mycena polygramma]|nr:hypothetical protein DFH06DRAFT_1345171 [Mycena polygramma]
MPRVATFASRSHKLNGPTYGRTPPSPPLKVLCPEPGCAWSFRSQGDLERHLPQHMSPEEREKLMHGARLHLQVSAEVQSHYAFRRQAHGSKASCLSQLLVLHCRPGVPQQTQARYSQLRLRRGPAQDKDADSCIDSRCHGALRIWLRCFRIDQWLVECLPFAVSSVQFFGASSDELLTFFSPPVSPSDLYLGTMSPSLSSGSSLPASPTDGAPYEDPSSFYPHPVSPSNLYPGLFPPSPSSSGSFASPPSSCDALWLPDLETCVVVGGGVEPTSAPGPAVFYPAEGVDSFASDYTTAYLPAAVSFDPTQFLCDFSAPRVYESAFGFDASQSYTLQNPGTPFSGEWVDVVC